MNTFLSRTLLGLGFLLSVVRTSEGAAPCCSTNQYSCSSTVKSYSDCLAKNSSTLVWFPEGLPADSGVCKRKWSNCTQNSECCGTFICEGSYSNPGYKRCLDAAPTCQVFNTPGYCASRSACKWDDSVAKCIPTFNSTYYEPDAKPPSRPESPGCCSTNQYKCLIPPATDYSDCLTKNSSTIVWFPEALPADAAVCKRKWSNCTQNSECCGNFICEGSYYSPTVTKCIDAGPACLAFNTSSFCGSRSACKWDASVSKCLPSFNSTYYMPGEKPASLPLTSACCSNDHLVCKRRYLVTSADCTAADPQNVWLPGGEGPGANNANCISRYSGVDCVKNTDCCGNMVCAPEMFNEQLRCRHPTSICPKFTTAGSWRCNAVPGCKWASGSCVVSFDTTVYDATAKAALPQAERIKTVLEGNVDHLGLCEGFVGSLSGDPHFSSFDRRTFDCMGTGSFVLVKAAGMLEIQGLFEKAGPGAASVAKGVAVDYPALGGVPRIQVSVAPNADPANETTYMISSQCAAHIYLDGELKVASRGKQFSDSGGSYAMLFNSDGGIDIQFFNTTTEPATPITALRVRVGGSPNSTFGCLMSIMTCLPLNEPALLKKTIGLFGTPNGNRDDEWTTPTGAIVPVVPKGPQAYEYCTNHHCVGRKSQSLFIHDFNKTYEQLYSCLGEYPGDPVDLDNVPTEIKAICGDNVECRVDGTLGGTTAAIRSLENQNLNAAVISSPNVTAATEFNMEKPAADLCKWPKPGSNVCPGDVTLLTKEPATSLPLFVPSPINIVAQNGDTVTLNISNPFKDTLRALYYQFTDGPSLKCLETANMASCMQPVNFTATCIAGYNATHQETRKYAYIDIWMTDPVLIKAEDNATIAECCQPEAGHGGKNTALFSYKVYCETSCPVTSTTRRTRALRQRMN